MPKNSIPEDSTRERLLHAAYLAFSRHGLGDTTTREIARLAKVNEVTLFRYFKNKQHLLDEVMKKSCQKFEAIFATAAFASSSDLRRTLTDYAQLMDHLLAEHENFVRTLYGEITRHPKWGRQIFVEASQRKRERFMAYFKAAQKQKVIRADLDLVTAVETFNGMILCGTLRRPLFEKEFSREIYIQTCVEIFLRGIVS